MKHELVSRILSAWRAKLFWALVLNLYFFIPYPLLERYHLGQPHVVLPCIVDRLIPFWPGSTWVYLSICLFTPLAPILMVRRDQLRRYGLFSLAMTSVAYLIYFVFPTTCVRPLHHTSTTLYDRMIAVDLPLNEFPSLHATYTIFTAFCLIRILAQMRAGMACTVGVIVWAAAILFTTLTTKQHNFVDLVGGALLAWSACCFVNPPEAEIIGDKLMPSDIQNLA